MNIVYGIFAFVKTYVIRYYAIIVKQRSCHFDTHDNLLHNRSVNGLSSCCYIYIVYIICICVSKYCVLSRSKRFKMVCTCIFAEN